MSPDGHVGRIPAEVLCEVFLILKDAWSLGDWNRLGWISEVTQVCKRWRDISLGLTFLWEDMLCAFPSPDATDAMLERARPTPLVFRAPDRRNATITPYQFSLAARHILNIRTLIYAKPYDWSDILCGKDLPCLRVLEVARWKQRMSTYYGYTSQYSVNAPMLQKLTLHNVLFPVNAPTLRYLKLDFHVECKLKRVLSAHLLSFLDLTPLLEELVLDHAIDDLGLAVSGSKTTLSHLRVLHYVDGANTLTFWGNVLAPPELAIRIELEYVEESHIFTLFTTMAQHLCNPSYDSLYVGDRPTERECRTEKFDIEVRLWCSSQIREWCDGQLDPTRPSGFSFKAHKRLQVEFDLDDDDSDDEDDEQEGIFNTIIMLKALTPHIEVARIRYLDIAEISEYENMLFKTEELRRVLMPFSAVETAAINSEVGHIRILGEGLVGHGDESAILFPALHRLIAYNHPGVDNIFFDGPKEAWDALGAVLRYRKNQQFPIAALTLTGGWSPELSDVGEGDDYLRHDCKYDRTVAYRDENGDIEDIDFECKHGLSLLHEIERYEREPVGVIDFNGLLNVSEIVDDVMDTRRWTSDIEDEYAVLVAKHSATIHQPYSPLLVGC